jgi:hypothetical protein
MDEKDRTGQSWLAIPGEQLALLRRVADEALERACDTGGEWDDEIRARVLDAAQAVTALHGGRLAAGHVARLASHALAWAEPPQLPTTLQQLADVVGWVGDVRALIALRDSAQQATISPS